MGDDADERREALRRRLYRPDASEDDRRAFAALAPEPLAAEAPDASPPPRHPDRRPRHRARTAAVAVGGALLVAGLVVAIRPPGSTTAQDGAAPTAAPSSSPTSPPPTTPPVAAGPSASPLADALPGGLTGSEVRATLGGTSTVLQRFGGTGTGTVALDLRGARDDGVLLVTLSGPGATWTASRQTASGGLEAVARGSAPGSGPASDGVVHYTGAPPTRILVQAGDGGAWAMTAAFLPEEAAAG